jgi:uncharacterized protein (DUF608 family)
MPMPTLDFTRREFLTAAGVAAAYSVWGVRPAGAVAGPFEVLPDFPIPADKKFDAAWIRALTERGAPTVYTSSRDELEFIGMPVGGICCGQVYLGGDGRLWHWDVFNLPQAREWSDSSGPLYARPAEVRSPFEIGFSLAAEEAGKPGTGIARALDATGFRDVSFTGQYPIGLVKYRDAGYPVEVDLEAFSPHVPLDAESSSIPVVLMRYTLRNTGATPLVARVTARVENPVCLRSGTPGAGERTNRALREGDAAWVVMSARESPANQNPAPARADVMFEDWERGSYEGWTVTGKAFGDKPRQLSDIAGYQGNVNAQGNWTVNTHETRSGEDVGKADTYLGTLTSREFTIERDFVRFRIGGGNHPGQTCVNLLVEGAPVRTMTGRDSNRMRVEHFDVREFAGQKARIQIVDAFRGGWGQIGVDEIVLTDSPDLEKVVLPEQPDFGTFAVGVLGSASALRDVPVLDAEAPKQAGAPAQGTEASRPFGQRLVCDFPATISLAPGETGTLTFAVAWHFPKINLDQLGFLKDAATLKRGYAARFGDASDVIRHISKDLAPLSDATRLWRDTWYDSTLPHWFLDRTLATISTLATSTCYSFDNGRFYGWEGTHCCAGTCTHVWQYAHAVGRLFPQLERYLREKIDFGQEFDEKSGVINYRGEAARHLAIDGQCGTILRAYREHLTSTDDAYLKKVWPNVKKALELVLSRDQNADGILDGEQYNTLDASWWGQISWISSLYLAASRAGAAMAGEMGDADFAARCTGIAESGSRALVEKLFNGEYFVHIPDPAHRDTNSTGDGCHADQLMGQAWAHQVGLGRIVPLEHSRSALASMYKYAFTPDIGPYRRRAEKTIKGGRWYAMPGEGGLLLCTWPRGGITDAIAKGPDAWAAVYFNECWTGFEHQVAAHMIWEGLALEGLAITKMLHDRHHASKRNPYNEVECSSHYARGMSSYGSFVAACGFELHGPRRHIGFAPRISPANFRAAFTGPEAWGTFEQTIKDGPQVCTITVKRGGLSLRTVSLEVPDPAPGAGLGAPGMAGSPTVPGVFAPGQITPPDAKTGPAPRTITGVTMTWNGQAAACVFKQTGRRVEIALDHERRLEAGQAVGFSLT